MKGGVVSQEDRVVDGVDVMIQSCDGMVGEMNEKEFRARPRCGQ